MTLEEIISELDQISDSLTSALPRNQIDATSEASFVQQISLTSADFLIFWKWPSQRTFLRAWAYVRADRLPNLANKCAQLSIMLKMTHISFQNMKLRISSKEKW